MNFNPTWLTPDGELDHEHIDFIDLLHECNTNNAYEPFFLAADLYDVGIRYIDDIYARDKNDIFTAIYNAGVDMELAALTAYKMKAWQAPGCATRATRPTTTAAAPPLNSPAPALHRDGPHRPDQPRPRPPDR